MYAVAHRRLRGALVAGRRVVFDATNLQERVRGTLYRAAERHGARLAIVVAYAPESVIRARLARRQAGRDPDDFSDADWAIYLRMRERPEPVRRPHVVANTCVSPAPLLRLLRGEVADPFPGTLEERSALAEAERGREPPLRARGKGRAI